MTKKRIHLIYSIVLSLALIVAGILFMIACARIYQGAYKVNDQLYSREAVAMAFAPIAIPVYIALALLIGSFLLRIFLPVENPKLSVEKQYDVILQKLLKKLDVDACDEALRRDILKQRKLRKIHTMISFSLLAVCSIVFLCYGVNINHFPLADATGSVRNAMWFFLPCLAIPFGYSVFAAYARKASVIKEIDLVKQAISQGCTATESKEEVPVKNRQKHINIARCAIICVAVGILVYGFVFGGTEDVLTKAINICTECVGLG